MARLVLALLVSAAAASGALAASITNAGEGTVTLTVVEKGTKVNVAIDAGATETMCPAGCFVTLPNGDRIGLVGNETVEIKNGAALIK
ncbi:hypothetical protein HFC70_08080 [Agrobacterium sp. a22-2]|uniref:hypothetical protein n=1 Tax=Agrobacterium sp. a22-2 TaxID=2283840 RepID=UPI00144716E9|nr:hypothetical protein [Agrobacterium sp. a22-2]NKN36315.1 hypothetical protein [Agrobacterium sp. a22-2]